MKKKVFTVKAVWDGEAGVFYSQSDITGFRIEAKTLEEFGRLVQENAADLIFENHVTPEEILRHPIRELIPTVVWDRCAEGAAIPGASAA